MANSSKILIDLIGPINTDEDFNKIKVNCLEDDESTDSAGLEEAGYSVLFPIPPSSDDNKEFDVVPLIGGSIVKISLEGSRVEPLGPAKLGRYDGPINSLKKSAAEIERLSIANPQKLSELTAARVKINKALQNMPNITTGLHSSGIPSLYISNLRSSLGNIDSVNSAIKNSGRTRLKSISKIGGMKFVPIEKIDAILGAVTNGVDSASDGDFGLTNYAGLSGKTFGSLYESIELADLSELSEETIAQILLDVFPIFHIQEKFLESKQAQGVIGYYTEINGSLYAKLPDLSGRNSSGVFNVEESSDDEALYFCFELINKQNKDYKALGFDHAFPPDIVVTDNNAGYPLGTADSIITIEKDGHKPEYKYFLSPIIAPQQSASLPSGFKKVEDAVEVFTAPLLTYPYYDAKSLILKPIVDYEKSKSELEGSVFRPLELYMLNMFPSPFSDPDATLADIYGDSDGELKDLGIPLVVSSEAIGVSNIADLLGEKNRPEIELGSRDSSKESYAVNDQRWFNEKICSAKLFTTFVCPNILTDTENFNQVPANWITLETEEDESGAISLKIPFTSNGIRKDGLDRYNPDIEQRFALYTVDKYGQIIRAFGENIKISPQVVILESITPNGFRGGETLSIGGETEQITISVDSEISDDPILNIYYENFAPKEYDVSNISIEVQGSQIIITSSGTLSLIESLFGTSIGSFFLEIKAKKDGAVGNYLPILIVANETPAASLPAPPEDKIEFDDPERLRAPRFGAEIDSIPLLMDDATNAEIILKYYKPVFRENLPLYGYIGILNTTNNNAILEDDIGWLGTKHKSNSELVYFRPDITESPNLIVPTGFEYELGTDYFSRINNRKVKLKFPGPGSKLNISRFNEFDAPSGEYKAYIILSNTKIDSSTFVLDDGNYAVIPLGSKGGEGIKPAFINPPYINALAMRVSGEGFGNDKSFTNIVSEKLTNYEKLIPWHKFDGTLEGESELKTNDKIERLAVVFDGPSDEPRKSRSYKITIGSGSNSKQIKNRLGLIRGLDNKLVANFFDISGITDTGFLDVIVTKTDKRFNATYSSVVYNRLTLDFFGDDIIEDSIVKDAPELGEEVKVLAAGANRLIPNITDNKINPYPNIFPASLGLSPIPLTVGSYLGEKDIVNGTAFLRFPNPIKVFPSVDLVFGSEVDDVVYGMFLSDSSVDVRKDNSSGEIIKINTKGETDVQLSAADVRVGVDRIREQGEERLASLNEEKTALQAEKDSGDHTPEEIATIDGKIQKIEEDQEEYSAALTTAEGATQTAEGASTAADAPGAPGAALSAADAATGAATDALDLLEAGLAGIQSLTDKLSSLTQLADQISAGATQSASAMGPRANDFTRTNINNIYIDKDSAIPTSFITKTDDNLAFKLTTTFKFGQVSAIKFNVPEIIKIIDEDLVYTRDTFSEFSLRSNKTFFIIAQGATKDTKVELGGRRIKILNIVKEGIYLRFKVKVPDLSKSSIYGADPCITLALTNSSEKHMQIARQLGNDIAIDLQGKIDKSISGGARSKRGSPSDLKEKLEERYLKFMSVTLDKANVPKEFIQSFCDMSFHLTAELTLQLRNFKVLMVPIKVIFCIIDVICALLNPIALVFAIIRLFLCLYDLILLLPQLSVPAMLLALVLHVVELLLCIIVKVLSIINAINEISTAIQGAIEQKNYPAIITLEETIDEHLASLEADLTVLDPILNVLALFLELLQLTFAFPCQIKVDDDDDACIDSSQLAALVMSRVAPAGRIVPDALLPMAQTYTTLPLDEVGSSGNTPPTSHDNGLFITNSTGGFAGSNILEETTEQTSATRIVIDNTGFGGRAMPGLLGGLSGDPVLIGPNGYFEGDLDGDGQHDNINYRNLRFAGGDFDGTFSLSFTKSVKEFAIFTGPDPRMVRFQFNERGKTDPLAFIPFLAPFFNKKNIDDLQTLDSPPGFLIPNGKELIIGDDITSIGFTSPIDGASDTDLTGGFFLTEKTATGTRSTFQPKPLTITFELQEPGVNPDTLSAEFTPVEVTKTFGSIPMIALIDDEFNVYFVEEADNGEGGIVVETIDGIPCITSIHAKMLNFPTAPKKKLSTEDREVYRSFSEIAPLGLEALKLGAQEAIEGIPAGQIMIYQQANQNSFDNDPLVTLPFSLAASTTQRYDYLAGAAAFDIDDFGKAVDTIKVFDFPTLYVVDMRQLSSDIAAACGASGPTELLLDLPGFTETDKIDDSITTLTDCMEAFLSYFNSTTEDSSGVPIGIIPKTRRSLSLGAVPAQIPIRDVISQYETLKDCFNGEIDNVCGFVINPLNTSFKLLNDEDETPLVDYVDPEQEDLATLIGVDLVDEIEFDEELEGFPKITGAMEYASGIGDSAIVEVGEKAVIKIIPRDCYDDVLSSALDLTESIRIDFLKDETGGAKLAPPSSEDSANIFEKNGGEYTFGITASAAGLVRVKATVCSAVIQAVTDRGIVNPGEVSAAVEVDCVDDSTSSTAEANEVFAPGALSKVDRVLTIMFVQGASSASNYGDGDRENSAKSSKPSPQAFGTKLEN
jgi:hypothetical protein